MMSPACSNRRRMKSYQLRGNLCDIDVDNIKTANTRDYRDIEPVSPRPLGIVGEPRS
jgi:hypothetical protein